MHWQFGLKDIRFPFQIRLQIPWCSPCLVRFKHRVLHIKDKTLIRGVSTHGEPTYFPIAYLFDKGKTTSEVRRGFNLQGFFQFQKHHETQQKPHGTSKSIPSFCASNQLLRHHLRPDFFGSELGPGTKSSAKMVCTRIFTLMLTGGSAE